MLSIGIKQPSYRFHHQAPVDSIQPAFHCGWNVEAGSCPLKEGEFAGKEWCGSAGERHNKNIL